MYGEGMRGEERREEWRTGEGRLKKWYGEGMSESRKRGKERLEMNGERIDTDRKIKKGESKEGNDGG